MDFSRAGYLLRLVPARLVENSGRSPKGIHGGSTGAGSTFVRSASGKVVAQSAKVLTSLGCHMLLVRLAGGVVLQIALSTAGIAMLIIFAAWIGSAVRQRP
ncbi:hypothetical protein BEL01nite_18520 [Bradyrhizobium elkanii]|nr:hypothetical protein BEL01nite_18520 [Bradyrhizobium elkanii]